MVMVFVPKIQDEYPGGKETSNTACRISSQTTWEKRGGGDGNEGPMIVAASTSQETRMDEDKSKLKPSQQDVAVGMRKLLVTVLGIE